MPSISLIITVFNRAVLLKKALLAITSQSMLPDEIIISDDGSSEDIQSVVSEYGAATTIPLTFVSQQDKGFRLAKCRNNAIKLARHDFLIFLDQDIIYTRDYLKTFAAHARPGLFLTSYPVRLTHEQSTQITDKHVTNADYSGILTAENLAKIKSQYRKECFYYWQKKLWGGKAYRPKIRGGASGLFKKDVEKVNGFDENFQGWGNEDDDFGFRLYAAGLIGKNVFNKDFPLHLWHEPFHDNGNRVNKSYYNDRKIEILNGDFTAVKGLREKDDEPLSIIRLNNEK